MKDYAKFISSLILFGGNGVMTAHILLPSCNIVVLRTLIGALFLGAVFALKRPRVNIKNARDMLFVIASGASMGLSWLFLYEAYRTVGVAISSLAYYCAPIMVMALSPAIFKERLTGGLALSLCIVFAGAILLNGASVSGGESAPWGLFCGWMSAICHAVMVICSKKADAVDGLVSSLLQLVASFAVAAGFLGFSGGLPFTVESSSWPWIAALGVVNTGLGCYLYFSSFEGLSAQTVAILGYIEPLSAVVCALAFLGEPIGHLQALGGLLVIGGALAGSASKERSMRT